MTTTMMEDKDDNQIPWTRVAKHSFQHFQEVQQILEEEDWEVAAAPQRCDILGVVVVESDATMILAWQSHLSPDMVSILGKAFKIGT